VGSEFQVTTKPSSMAQANFIDIMTGKIVVSRPATDLLKFPPDAAVLANWHGPIPHGRVLDDGRRAEGEVRRIQVTPIPGRILTGAGGHHQQGCSTLSTESEMQQWLTI